MSDQITAIKSIAVGQSILSPHGEIDIESVKAVFAESQENVFDLNLRIKSINPQIRFELITRLEDLNGEKQYKIRTFVAGQ